MGSSSDDDDDESLVIFSLFVLLLGPFWISSMICIFNFLVFLFDGGTRIGFVGS